MQVSTNCQLRRQLCKSQKENYWHRLHAYYVGYLKINSLKLALQKSVEISVENFSLDLTHEGLYYLVTINNSYFASLPCDDESIAKVAHSIEGIAYINCKINSAKFLQIFRKFSKVTQTYQKVGEAY